MKTPCANCPFRISPRFPSLSSYTIFRIRDDILADGGFPCHKDLTLRTPCIGAVSVFDHQYGAGASFWIKMGIMCGAIEYPIAHDVPVYRSFEEAAAAMSGEVFDAT